MRHLVATFQTLVPEIGKGALAQLAVNRGSSARAALESLASEIARLPERAVLFLDDLHALHDEEALATLKRVCELEGIIPALESSHALAWALRGDVAADTLDVVCLSGRGDKDLGEVLPKLGLGQ